MKKKSGKFIFLQIRRHYGEIDWLLPLLFKLKKKGFTIITHFDEKNIYTSLKKNSILFNSWSSLSSEHFIRKKTDKFFLKIILKLLIILNKIFKNNFVFNKLQNNLISDVYNINKIFDKFSAKKFKYFFISNNNHSNLYLNFKKKNQSIKIIRFPTSQWTRSILKKNRKEEYKRFYGDKYLFKGLNEAKYYFGKSFKSNLRNKKIIFCGNMKYENWWLKKMFRQNIVRNRTKELRLLVATRGYRSKPKNNFPKSSFYKIITSIVKLKEKYKNIYFIFKAHPSQSELIYLKKILKKYNNIKYSISHDHVSNIIQTCNLGITLHTSGCEDIVSMKKVCIEFWLNDIDYYQLKKFRNKYYTTYQRLGLVKNVNNFNELYNYIEFLKSKKNYTKIQTKQYKNFLTTNEINKFNSNSAVNKLIN